MVKGVEGPGLRCMSPASRMRKRSVHGLEDREFLCGERRKNGRGIVLRLPCSRVAVG